MPKPTLTVRGVGHVEGPPELATVAVTVRAVADTAAQVAQQLAAAAQRTDQARPDLQFAGVYTDAVQISPRFNRKGDTVVGYEGSSTSRLVLADFTRLSDLVMAMAGQPDTSVGGPWWSLAPTSPLYAQARIAAVDDAYTRARDYADAVGGSLGELLELSDVEAGFGGGMRRYAMAAAAVADEPSFDFRPQPESVDAQVTAVFRLVDPQGPGSAIGGHVSAR